MKWKNEWKALSAMVGVFLLSFFLPIDSVRFQNAIMESLYMLKEYAQLHVILCLLPALFIAGAISVFISQAAVIKYLGAKAKKVTAYAVASVSGAMLAEWFFSEKNVRGKSLFDGSGLLTGILLGLTLPPGMPMWMGFLGGVMGIALGKLVMGGLGQNMFNPALVGRAFLQAAFPTAITTWNPPAPGGIEAFATIRESNFAAPFMQSSADAVTTASPLGLMKFEQEPTSCFDLLIGNTAGSLGETCAIIIIIVGLIMALR